MPARVAVASNDYNAMLGLTVVRESIGDGIDGLILVGADRPREIWDLLAEASIPTVLTWCADPRHDAVVDNGLAGRLAAEHLLDLGHRRFGVVAGTLRTNDRQRQRAGGVREQLKEAGLKLED